MKSYYAQRNGLILQPLNLSLDELRQAFSHLYTYFQKSGAFEAAFCGCYDEDRWSHKKIQVYPPRMAPSPSVFFMVHLQDKQVWPIEECFESYSESTLFSVIEILYDHIGKYDLSSGKFEAENEKSEYANLVNNLLKAYGEGFYLEPKDGFIMHMPNEALKAQLSYSGKDMPSSTMEQLMSATKQFYRYDADLETKKKAITTLADILENVRNDLKEVLNQEYGIAKNEHDKLIFGIVNTYNIRHNKDSQLTDYNREIWYDWMMQYYTSTIITYYKLKKAHEDA